MATGLELYEALKPTVGEEAAKMIAESMPLSDQIATKSDLEHFQLAMRADLHALEARISQRMVTFNITLFLGLAGMIVAIVLKR